MVPSVLDLATLIPERIAKTQVSKQVFEKTILISGRYSNHRRFSIKINRFIDDKSFYFGCGLYAGEGTKGGKGTPFEFANSNPNIIRTVIGLLDQLGIGKSTVSPRVQVRVTVEEATDDLGRRLTSFWSDCTGIPTGRFRKPSIRIKLSGAGRSEHGTVSIRINSGIVGTLFNFWTNQILRDQRSLQS